MDTTRSEKPQYLWWIAGAAALGVLLYLLVPILAPFLFAAIRAYTGNPLENPAVKVLPSIATGGMALLAVPVGAALLVCLRHMRRRYLGSGMYDA